MTVQEDVRNIYYNARRTAGLTQERWAEFLGISPEAVRLYETGKNMPGDEIVIRMADVSGVAALGYWHLQNKSRIAAEDLPDVPDRRIPEAVISLLCQIRDFQEESLPDLLKIASDGRIDQDEREDYCAALTRLRELISASIALLYAKEA